MKKYFLIVFSCAMCVLIYAFILGKKEYALAESWGKIDIQSKTVVNVEGVDHVEEKYFAPAGIYSQEEMLKTLNTEIDPVDKISVFPDPKYGVGGTITVLRATVVKVDDGGYSTEYHTWKKTVGELLEEKNIQIFTDDKMSVNENQVLNYGIEIKITRVKTQEVKEFEKIEFKKVTKKDNTLEKGTKKVSQVGKVGKRALIYAVRKENGKEISKVLMKKETVTESQDEITLEGTKVIKLGEGTATWYDLISGMKAAHNTLPMGTQVLVRNVANGKEVVVTIADRGIQGGAVIDLSAEAFKQLSPLGAGKISVVLEKP